MNDLYDIEKIRTGDQEAFKAFYTAFYPKMKALAFRFVNEHVAEDLVQEVFLSYWEKKQEIEAYNIQSFLYRCIQNTCLNHIKHQRVVGDYESQVFIAEERITFLKETTDENEVFQQLVQKDIREIIDASVDKLPPKCAEAFRLCYFYDMSRIDAANVVGASPRTVDGYIQKALNFLRDDLKDLYFLFFYVL